MDEFLKLDWRIRDPADLENRTCFLTDEEVSDSFVYKNFTKSIRAKPQATIKLHISTEKYVPGKKYFKVPKGSGLMKKQRELCLKALKLVQMGKNTEIMTPNEKACMQTYIESQAKIGEENRKFLANAKNVWMRNKNKPLNIRPSILSYSTYYWKQKLEQYTQYPQFYNEILQISMCYDESEGIVHYEQILNVLELGILARFAAPSLKVMCCLKLVTLPHPDCNKVVNSKLSVSKDENIAKLLENHSVDVVISSSGLKQIIDYTDTKTKWIIPVVIKEVESNGKKKKTVFIDKVLPKTHPSYHDFKYYAYKQLVKTNLCQYEAFSFPSEEKGESEIGTDDENPEQEKKKQRNIFHNVSYRIWKIKKTSDQNNLMKNKTKDMEINLLVRCKLDACESTDQGILQPVIVNPKLEQQLQLGVNIASKSELSREWTSLFFRPYSNLYRARIQSHIGEVISVEKCTLQKINSEAHIHYDYKPAVGLGVLQKVLEQLIQQNPGNYLLQHFPKNESFISLMKEGEETPNCFDLHLEESTSSVDRRAQQPWLPIDVNYILPIHEELNLLPGIFQRYDDDQQEVTKKTKKKKGVKNKGKQTPQGEMETEQQ